MINAEDVGCNVGMFKRTRLQRYACLLLGAEKVQLNSYQFTHFHSHTCHRLAC